MSSEPGAPDTSTASQEGMEEPAKWSRPQSPPGSSLLRLPAGGGPYRPPLTSGGRKVILISVLALIVLLIGGLATLLLVLSHKGPGNTVLARPVIGHVFFLSSGQRQENSSQGINDEVIVDLHQLPDPAPGKSYYAWLLPDRNQVEAPAVFLGKVALSHGNAHFLYAGDRQHTNLLKYTSRFLITEEDALATPLVPTLSTSRYYAEIAQTNVLYHLRHLLADAPELEARGLYGGLSIWLVQNTLKLLEWANSARGDWSDNAPGALRSQVIRILDYLDGASFVRTDLPPATPVLVNSHNAQVPLLGVDPHDQRPPGYLYPQGNIPGYLLLIGRHLNALAQSPGVTRDQEALAAQIDTELDRIKLLFGAIHDDAKQLFAMSDAQLSQPVALSFVNDMVTQAGYAYLGQFDPSTQQVQAGVLQMHLEIQRLTSLGVESSA